MRGGPYHRAIGLDPQLYSHQPAVRLAAARAVAGRARRKVLARGEGWPDLSPGAVNAWLLLVTTKPPSWRDPLVLWPTDEPALGDPHPGFFYPDPLGFWAEVRRWATALLQSVEPGWAAPDALSVTTLLHLGDDQRRLAWANATMQPRLTLFLDEPAWHVADLQAEVEPFTVPDPHRLGQSYEGWWGTAGGAVVGKAPQHPAAHRLYRTQDLDAFLRAAPRAG